MSELKGVSPWFMWHRRLFGKGRLVLDVACGSGRHARAAAQCGAKVVAVDSNLDTLREAKKASRKYRRFIKWGHADLEREPPPGGPFDVVMIFNYLDRQRMPVFLEATRAGGYLVAETFLEQQRTLETGPTSDDHLLRHGELVSLVQPFEIVHAREVLEVIDGRPRFVASVVARRVPQ